eukprot:scaffold7979_cov417-Prasinococcus_capsulatus_cf.AAC.12
MALDGHCTPLVGYELHSGARGNVFPCASRHLPVTVLDYWYNLALRSAVPSCTNNPVPLPDRPCGPHANLAVVSGAYITRHCRDGSAHCLYGRGGEVKLDAAC